MKRLTLFCLILGACGGETGGPVTQLSKEEAAAASGGAADSATDYCELYDWYGDGECDTFCALPDPDCGAGDAGVPDDGGAPVATACDEVISLAPGDHGTFVATVHDQTAIEYFLAKSAETFERTVEYSGVTRTVTLDRSFPWQVSVRGEAGERVLEVEELRAQGEGRFVTSGPPGSEVIFEGLNATLSIGAAQMPDSRAVVYYEVGSWDFDCSASPAAAWVASGEIELSNGDRADLYYPNPPASVRTLFTDAFPVAVVLQGAQVDKSQYADFARALAEHGFVVVVPNRLRALGPPGSPAVPFTEANVIAEALTSVEALDRDPSSSLFQIADTSQSGVVGHSFGGVAGLQALGGLCQPPFCTPPFALPPAVRAGAFYGTDLFPPGPPGAPLIDVATGGIGVALILGSLDGRSLPERVEATYGVLDDNRALVTVAGANHYGITNDAAPAGSQPDPNAATLANEESVRAIAEWTATWLRAELRADQGARFRLTELGRSSEGSVVVDDVRLN